MHGEDLFIVGKSDIDNKDFDVLVFADRSVSEITIPPSIKYIDERSLSSCKKLTVVNIPKNSELLYIGENSFTHTRVSSLCIPSKVKMIARGWCKSIKTLTNVKISSRNPNFSYTGPNEALIIGKSDTNNKFFDVIVFACRNVEYAIVPSYIKTIEPYAFQYCTQLKVVEFESDSNLHSIKKYAFANTAITSIKIPMSVSVINKYAFFQCQLEPKSKLISFKYSVFYKCKSLKKVIIPDDAALQIFEPNAFDSAPINELFISSNVEVLIKYWYKNMDELSRISVSKNNHNFKFIDEKNYVLVGKSLIENDVFDVLVYVNKLAKSISIPRFVSKIDAIISNCSFLKFAEFLSDELKTSDLILNCKDMEVLSLPNMDEIEFVYVNSKDLTLFVHANAKVYL